MSSRHFASHSIFSLKLAVWHSRKFGLVFRSRHSHAGLLHPLHPEFRSAHLISSAKLTIFTVTSARTIISADKPFLAGSICAICGTIFQFEMMMIIAFSLAFSSQISMSSNVKIYKITFFTCKTGLSIHWSKKIDRKIFPSLKKSSEKLTNIIQSRQTKNEKRELKNICDCLFSILYDSSKFSVFFSVVIF